MDQCLDSKYLTLNIFLKIIWVSVGFSEINTKVCKNASMQVFWVETFSTQILPGPNFFKPSVPGSLRIFRAFASLFKYTLITHTYLYSRVNVTATQPIARPSMSFKGPLEFQNLYISYVCTLSFILVSNSYFLLLRIYRK